MKQMVLLLTITALVHAVTFKFGAGVFGNYDSNIGQNYHEESGSYFVPELSAEVKFSKLSLFTELVYDFHVTERDFDDNSPFLQLGSEADLSLGSFNYKPALIYELFLANDVYRSYGGEPENLVPVIQEYFLLNDFSLKKKRKAAGVVLGVSYQDWANGDGEQSGYLPEKEGFYLTVEPYLKRSWKVKKRESFKLTSLSAELKYEHAFLDERVDSYNYLKGRVKSSMKLLYPELSLSMSYGKKSYLAKNDHPVNGVYEKQWKRYVEIAPAVEFPLPVGLSFEFEADFDMKYSNFPDDEFNRTVLTAALKWNGKIERDKE